MQAMDRENLKLQLQIAGLRLKGVVRMLVALIGFAAITYGAWSAYSTWQAVGGTAALNSQEYLPQLVAVDLIIILVGAGIVLLATR